MYVLGSQLIKDLLELLLADGRIESDKIGAGRFYWLFPAAAAQRAKKRKADVDREIDTFEEKKRRLNEEIASAQLGKENTEERKELLKEMKSLEEETKELDEKLAKYADFDPELVAKLKSDAKKAQDAANRWTDNIFVLKKYSRNELNIDNKDFDKMFELPVDFDYIE